MELYARQHVSRGFSRKDLKIIELITSRGCPHNCIFCAGHINYGYRLRFRSLENVAGEIDQCIQQYGITHVSIRRRHVHHQRKLPRDCAISCAGNG